MPGGSSDGVRKRPSAAAAAGPPRRVRKLTTQRSEGNALDCFCSESGEWLLTGGRATRSGTYSFDRKTRKLYDERKELLADMVYQPIGKRVLLEGSKVVPEILQSEIMKEIQNVENADAFFVLPSQLNGAEYVSYTAPCDLIGHYLWDNTAGPRGQLAIHPAIGQFLLDSASQTERADGIDVTRPLFEAMPGAARKGFFCENGYLRVPRWPCEEDFRFAHKAMEVALPFLHTVAALDAVVAGLAPSLKDWARAEHRVNMVYASAVPVSAYNNPAAAAQTRDRQQTISSLLMRGAYFGALTLALEKAKKTGSRARVFFMPLGGGVFNNEPKAIADAMQAALQAANSGGEVEEYLDVRVLTWEGKPIEAKIFRALFNA